MANLPKIHDDSHYVCAATGQYLKECYGLPLLNVKEEEQDATRHSYWGTRRGVYLDPMVAARYIYQQAQKINDTNDEEEIALKRARAYRQLQAIAADIGVEKIPAVPELGVFDNADYHKLPSIKSLLDRLRQSKKLISVANDLKERNEIEPRVSSALQKKQGLHIYGHNPTTNASWDIPVDGSLPDQTIDGQLSISTEKGTPVVRLEGLNGVIYTISAKKLKNREINQNVLVSDNNMITGTAYKSQKKRNDDEGQVLGKRKKTSRTPMALSELDSFFRQLA